MEEWGVADLSVLGEAAGLETLVREFPGPALPMAHRIGRPCWSNVPMLSIRPPMVEPSLAIVMNTTRLAVIKQAHGEIPFMAGRIYA